MKKEKNCEFILETLIKSIIEEEIEKNKKIEECPWCYGTGIDDGEAYPKSCPKCHGYGFITNVSNEENEEEEENKEKIEAMRDEILGREVSDRTMPARGFEP